MNLMICIIKVTVRDIFGNEGFIQIETLVPNSRSGRRKARTLHLLLTCQFLLF